MIKIAFSKTWEGAWWKIFSCACFAVINGIVRYLSGGTQTTDPILSLEVIIFFQNVFGTLFLLPWALKLPIHTFKIHHLSLHIIRVSTAVLGIYLWYLTLTKMPIAEGVALSFTGPIFTVVGAWILLKEHIGIQRFLAILLSLIGAFIISRPDIPLSGGTHPIGFAVIFPLASALVLAISKLLTRKLANLGESPTLLALYLLVFMAPVSLVPALFHWETPTLSQLPWLILMGALASAAHLSFSKAYQLAEVTFLTPFGFSKFLLSALVGFVSFSELPTAVSLWLGMSIIFASILLLAYKLPSYTLANRKIKSL